MRSIMKFEFQRVRGNEDPSLEVWMAVIRGSAFLWHQVRCMMSVLFMIGRNEEPEEVIDVLFDTEILKERPQYDIAEGNNLILSECGYDEIEW